MLEMMEAEKTKPPIKKENYKRRTRRHIEIPKKTTTKRASHRKKRSEFHSNLNHLVKAKPRKVKHKSFRKISISQTQKQDIDKQHITPAIRKEKDFPEQGVVTTNQMLLSVQQDSNKQNSPKQKLKKTPVKPGVISKKGSSQKASAKKPKQIKRGNKGLTPQIRVSKTSLSPKKGSREKLPKSGNQKKLKKKERKSTRRLRTSKTEKFIKISKKSFKKKDIKIKLKSKPSGKINISKVKAGRIRKSKRSSLTSNTALKKSKIKSKPEIKEKKEKISKTDSKANSRIKPNPNPKLQSGKQSPKKEKSEATRTAQESETKEQNQTIQISGFDDKINKSKTQFSPEKSRFI